MVDPRFISELDRAVEIAERDLAALLALPGVIGVGAGPERKGGRLTGRAAIVIGVREKQTAEALAEQGIAPLPEEIEGIAVDVIEFHKPQEAPDLRAAQARAIAAKKRIEGDWLARPNVTGIGVAYKRTAGQRSDVVAITVYVERKLSAAELTRHKVEPVPDEIDGVPTDVVTLPRMRPAASASGSRADRKDPLVGGISVGTANRPFFRGTLGSIVFDRASGGQRVLSNEHVFDGAIDEKVIQPAPIGLDDSVEIAFQLDLCNPLHFFRLDTPNTTLGTILAGGATAAILAAALSDEIDPTRRGQIATPPPPGAKTLAERHSVHLRYGELPIPGTPFEVGTEWTYKRETTLGDFSHSVAETRKNPHVLRYKALLTDRTRYRPGDLVRLYGVIIGQTQMTRRHCEAYHCVALLTPTKVDRLFPVVLREAGGDFGSLLGVVAKLLKARGEAADELVPMIRAGGCIYTGGFVAGEDVPLGPWRHYLYVQTVNTVADGTKPEVAAQTIGGLPLSQNAKPTLDIACGPFIYEDGAFDIELI